jgi:hypothetical protein
MRAYLKFFIGGTWVEPAQPKTLEVINPATETVCGHISLGSAADVDRAVKAAREAFKTFSPASREERIELLERIAAEYEKRREDIAKAPGGTPPRPRLPLRLHANLHDRSLGRRQGAASAFGRGAAPICRGEKQKRAFGVAPARSTRRGQM